MAITKERFNLGMTYDEAREKLPRNKPLLDQIEGDLKISEADLAPWRSLPQTYNVMALVIDPCPDVATNVPIMARIAKESGKANFRIFMRDDNKDLMADFMNGPYESVPVFAVFDQDFNLRSVFIERPKSVTEERARRTREIQEKTPEFGPVGTQVNDMAEDVRERYRTALAQMRTETNGYYVSESVRELREMAGELAGTAPAKWHGNLAEKVTA